MIDAAERAFARRLVRLILGIDGLYLRQLPDDSGGLAHEGYVAINLSHEEPDHVATYAEAQECVATLRAELGHLTLAPNRAQYFADYLTAVNTFCRWQSGEPDVPSYPDLVRALMGIPGEPPALEPLLASTESALRAAGFRGALPDMIAAFRSSREVPVDRVVGTMERYLAEARSWVVENLFPLPDDFQFDVVGERDMEYNAYCGYVERAIRINLDIPFTHEELKHLACHEAYPGHSTQIWRHEQLVPAGAMTEDGLLIVTDTPTTSLFEGIGEVGLRLVGWDRSDEERLHYLVARLTSAVDCRAGYLFAEGRRQEAMELMALYGGEEWAAMRERLLDMPIRGPFICAYYYGDRLVHSVLDRTRNENAFLHYLYDLNHSPASFEMFSDG